MLHQDTGRWLNSLRMHGRIRLKNVPISIATELVKAKVARISGGNLVITSVGMNGSPRTPAQARAPMYQTYVFH